MDCTSEDLQWQVGFPWVDIFFSFSEALISVHFQITVFIFIDQNFENLGSL
jgi:hypothetical protein